MATDRSRRSPRLTSPKTLTAVALVLGGVAAPLSWSADPTPTPYAALGHTPYADTTDQRLEPEPELEALASVRIGMFAPTRGPRGLRGEAMRRGAELAIERANASGGYNGVLFELVVRPDDHIWGSAREVVQLAYADRVWAVVGAIGGESTHIAEQIVTKAHLPLVAPEATEASLTQINIPWMFRCMPGDDEVVRPVVSDLVRRGLRRVAVVMSQSYDHRHRGAAFLAQLEASGASVVAAARLQAGAQGAALTAELQPLIVASPDAVVVWTGSADGVRLVRWFREQDLESPVYGGPDLATPELMASLGTAADGLRVVTVCDLERADEPARRFQAAYREHYGAEPTAVAGLAHDGTEMVVRAVRSGGLNRARIRDALAAMEHYEGVCGPLAFDGTGASTSIPTLSMVREGGLVPILAAGPGAGPGSRSRKPTLDDGHAGARGDSSGPHREHRPARPR